MYYALKRSTLTFRIGLVLSLLAIACATQAFASTETPAPTPETPAIRFYQIDKRFTAGQHELYQDYFIDSISVHETNSDIRNKLEKFPVSYTNYMNDPANRPTITKVEGKNNQYKIVFRTTTKNLANISVPNQNDYVRAFAPPGVTVKGMAMTPLNDFTKNRFISAWGHDSSHITLVDAHVQEYFYKEDLAKFVEYGNRQAPVEQNIGERTSLAVGGYIHAPAWGGKAPGISNQYTAGLYIGGKNDEPREVYQYSNEDGQLHLVPWGWTEWKPTENFDYLVTINVEVGPTANIDTLSCQDTATAMSTKSWKMSNRRGFFVTSNITPYGNDNMNLLFEEPKEISWFAEQAKWEYALDRTNTGSVYDTLAGYCFDLKAVMNGTATYGTVPTTAATVPSTVGTHDTVPTTPQVTTPQETIPHVSNPQATLPAVGNEANPNLSKNPIIKSPSQNGEYSPFNNAIATNQGDTNPNTTDSFREETGTSEVNISTKTPEHVELSAGETGVETRNESEQSTSSDVHSGENNSNIGEVSDEASMPLTASAAKPTAKSASNHLELLGLLGLLTISAGLMAHGVRHNKKERTGPSGSTMIDINTITEVPRPRMSNLASDKIEYIDVYTHYKAGQFTRTLAQRHERESFMRRLLSLLIGQKEPERVHSKNH